MTKIRKTYRLPEDVIGIIEETKIENGLSTETDALINLIRASSDRGKAALTETDKNEIADIVVSAIKEKYKKTFDRIRLASTFAERYSYIILDAINTMLYETDASFLMPAIGEQQHVVIRESLAKYKEMVERNKQVKDNENLKRG